MNYSSTLDAHERLLRLSNKRKKTSGLRHEDINKIAVFDKPSWLKSISRLKWCCSTSKAARPRRATAATMESLYGYSESESLSGMHQVLLTNEGYGSESSDSDNGDTSSSSSTSGTDSTAVNSPESINHNTAVLAKMRIPAADTLVLPTSAIVTPDRAKSERCILDNKERNNNTNSNAHVVSPLPPKHPTTPLARPPMVLRGKSLPSLKSGDDKQDPRGSIEYDTSSPSPRPPLPSRSRTGSYNHGAPTPTTPARPRLGTENTNGTNSSYHRRQAHESFQFSVQSLTDIYGNGPVKLPSSFELDIDAEYDHNNQDDISLWLSDEEDFESGYISVDEEEDCAVKSGPAVVSPSPKAKVESWMSDWADLSCANMMEQEPEVVGVPIKQKSDVADVPSKHDQLSDSAVYLPVSNFKSNLSDKNVVALGWAAVSTSGSLQTRLAMCDGTPEVHRSDIAFLQMVKDNDGNTVLQVHQDDRVKEIKLTSDLQAMSQDICSRAGRFVVIQDAWTRKIACVILPVSLPHFFFVDNKLVSANKFGLLAPTLFTPFHNASLGSMSKLEWGEEYCERLYAPDEQHDAATHLMFCLDSAIRQA